MYDIEPNSKNVLRTCKAGCKTQCGCARKWLVCTNACNCSASCQNDGDVRDDEDED